MIGWILPPCTAMQTGRLMCSSARMYRNMLKTIARQWLNYGVSLNRAGGIVMVPIHLTLKKVREYSPKTSASERWKYFGEGDHVRVVLTRRVCG